MFHELVSRDHQDGRATGQPSRGTAGLVSVSERYVAGGACPACPERSRGEPVEGTPEDARLPARRAYSSERRKAISVVAASDA